MHSDQLKPKSYLKLFSNYKIHIFRRWTVSFKGRISPFLFLIEKIVKLDGIFAVACIKYKKYYHIIECGHFFILQEGSSTFSISTCNNHGNLHVLLYQIIRNVWRFWINEFALYLCLLYWNMVITPIKWKKSYSTFNPRLTGGYLETPSRFSSISSKRIEISALNFQYLLIHQFATSWLNTKFVAIIGRPEMTSEWRHVRSTLMQNKVLQESLSWAQFLS